MTDPTSADVAENATPTTVDVEALLAQIQKLQTQMDAMNAAAKAAAGDPVKDAAVDFVQHISARANATPQLDWSTLKDVAKDIQKKLENGVEIGEVDAKKAVTALEGVAVHAARHELGYLPEIGRNLMMAVLNAA